MFSIFLYMGWWIAALFVVNINDVMEFTFKVRAPCIYNFMHSCHLGIVEGMQRPYGNGTNGVNVHREACEFFWHLISRIGPCEEFIVHVW